MIGDLSLFFYHFHQEDWRWQWRIHRDSFDPEEQLREAVVVSLCPRVSMRSVTPDWPRSTRGAFAADSDLSNGQPRRNIL